MKHPGHITLENMNQALWYNRWTMNKFKQFLHGDILEVGCGIGNFTQSLASFGSVWAIDIDAVCISETKKRAQKKARVGFGDIEKGNYFFSKKRFDSIVCLNVLEHIRNDGRAIANIYRLLSPGGHLILLVPMHQELYGSIDRAIQHFRRYDNQKLTKLLTKNKFHIVSVRKLNFLGAVGWWVAGKILKSETVEDRQIKLFNGIAPFVLPLEDLFPPVFGTSVLVVAQKTIEPDR